MYLNIINYMQFDCSYLLTISLETYVLCCKYKEATFTFINHKNKYVYMFYGSKMKFLVKGKNENLLQYIYMSGSR